jgi:pyruvate/2-oxoglutarate dehydrogenase complex dihydrolipoamide acyltransferase (E2) component
VPFSGTITKLLLPDGDGTIVKMGQPIFKIEPDDKRVGETAGTVATRRRALTDKLLSAIR